MTAITVPAGGPPACPVPISGNRLIWTVRDGITVTWRNLLGYVRVPQSAFFAAVQPIMFVLLFRYAFAVIGLGLPKGIPYQDFLLPGVFVQTVTFGCIGAAIGLAEDLQKGLLERFRSLPMARSAVLFGRTTADLVRNVFVVAVLTGVGYAVGFRVHTGVAQYFAGAAILLLFSYALFWGAAFVGMSAPNSEVAQLMMFPLLMPLTFASSAFVPVNTMPGWLQAFANNQPVTIVADATRHLMLGVAPFDALAVPALKAVAWGVGLLLVLVPLAVRKYRRLA